MSASHVLIQPDPAYSFEFSICTIVNNQEEYQEMKQSFRQCGFEDECEYLVADNTVENKFDAYQAIAAFMKQASGRFLIIVHQDVRCIDTKAQLKQCLKNLTTKDSKWAICGNAGAYGYHARIMHLTNIDKVLKYSNLPAQVDSLDENLLVINRVSNLTISADLTGYHLYGTDLCLIADFLGYTSYVIPFMVNHLSTGNLKALDAYIPAFRAAYGRKLRSRYIETTCTKFYLSNGVTQNKMYNTAGVFGVVKVVERLRQIIKVIKDGKQHQKIK
jgi:hypothetical protein